MKKTLLEIKFSVLMLAVSTLAFGQSYSGTNPNIAAFKTASVSDTVTDHGPELAVDTLLLTYASVSGDAPAWLQIDLGTWYTIDGYGMILPLADELPTTISFERSSNGGWWRKLDEISIDAMGLHSYDIQPVDSVRYINFNITGKHELASFTEVMVYGEEMLAPTPPLAYSADNITPTGFTASWSDRDAATGYKLSIATDNFFTQIVPGYEDFDVGNVLSFEVSDLTPGTTYYYGVHAYNIIGTSVLSNQREFTTPKAPQTITFDSLEAYTYGDIAFELLATSSADLPLTYTNTDGNVATISGSTVTILTSGLTTITASQAGNDQYLAADPVSWNLVVEKKELLIEGATVASRVYDGTTDAVISGAILTGVVGSDDVSLINEDAGTFVQSGVGTVIEVQTDMTVTGVDLDNYIQPVIPAFTADITPVELTAMTDDQSREECSANPEFTYSITGFIDGEDDGVLITDPTITCEADENSGSGSYDILILGAEAANYTFTYASGTLTVNADATLPELTVKDITIQLTDGYALVEPEDVVVTATDNCIVMDTTLSQSIFIGDDIGTVAVDVTLKDAVGNTTTKVSNVTVEGPNNILDIEGYRTVLYPNPVKDLLTIETETPGQLLVQISSLNGKVVHSFVQTSALHREDLSSLKSGAYFVTIRSEGQVSTMKLLKL